MRVLVTADTVGGVWSYAMELARALAGHGVHVDLATMGAPLSERQRREADEIAILELFESEFKLEWMEDPWDDVRRAGDWLLGLEHRLRPDVVHLNGYCHGALPWLAPTVMVGHSCVLSWWEGVKGEPAPASWERYACDVRQGLWAADLVVTPSHSMLAALLRHYGPLPRTRVIYNARNPALFSPNTIKEPMVLTAGRLWDEAKNVRALARIAPRLPWPVYVAGEEKRPGGGVVDGSAEIRHLGHLDSNAMRSWFARSAIYAHPARYEAFGLSALEAALSRCSLVLGDIASQREIWGDAAILVPPNDDAALEAALRKLIARPAARQKMAERAYERALHYSPQRLADGYLAAYEYVLRPAESAVTAEPADVPARVDVALPAPQPAAPYTTPG